MLLTSCGDTKTGGPGTAAPVSVESPTSTRSAPGSTTTSQPQETCAAFLSSAPCTKYTGISGTANNEALPWVASGGVNAQLAAVNGELLLSVTTRCAPMSGPATITGTTLTVRNIAIGASGCTEDGGDQQQWVLEFLKRPIEQTFSNGTLTWKSGTDTLNFKSE
ncbi:META domain-containing protein [Arthrobacter sp. ISL-72]|nr:META domain-containing protein [Arthrobacter sp. ISL-72]MBT2598130.1 META domain-containing protein [Arthrobacter sp. ISL-72]